MVNKEKYYVIFFCNWRKESSSFLLNDFKFLTPNNNGIFDRLIGTNNYDKADIVIFMEGIPSDFKYNLNNKVVICYPREPFFEMKKNWERLNLKYGYTYDNIYHVFADFKFLNKSYDFLVNLKYESIAKNKLLSMIVSGKGNKKGHLKRRIFTIKLSNEMKSLCHIYGSKWNNDLNKDAYFGELGNYHNDKKKDTSKYDGLINYKYSICIENIRRKNYFSEKFTDAILCFTIPIYFGCPNISDFFPKNCYYEIDINDSQVYEKIKKIIDKPIDDSHIKDLHIARDLILNKYNIWAQTNLILSNN